MNPNLDEIVENLTKIEWLANCGKPLPDGFAIDFEIFKIENWRVAKKYYNSRKWESVLGLVKSLRSGDLNRSKYTTAEWNSTNTRAFDYLEEKVLPHINRVIQEKKLDEQIGKEIHKHIIMGVMEQLFRDANIYPFGSNLLKVYEVGHFPCGWEGEEWPDGKLVVL